MIWSWKCWICSATRGLLHSWTSFTICSGMKMVSYSVIISWRSVKSLSDQQWRELLCWLFKVPATASVLLLLFWMWRDLRGQKGEEGEEWSVPVLQGRKSQEGAFFRGSTMHVIPRNGTQISLCKCIKSILPWKKCHVCHCWVSMQLMESIQKRQKIFELFLSKCS